jgi:NitT/TauT family transport system substrate-binding protein
MFAIQSFLSKLAITIAGLFLATNAAHAAENVRIGVDFNVLGAQVWVAQEKGLFEKHGINAEIIPLRFGVDTIDATLTGQIDFGLGLDFATTTRLKSGQLKILAAVIEPEAGFHKLAVVESIHELAMKLRLLAEKSR